VAVALGHATDDLVLGRVADASFPTPTAFGAWLRSALEEKRGRARQAAEAEAIVRSQELLGRLGQVQRLQASLAWWRAAALALAALGAAAAAWLLLGR
jgi:exonuclease VII large subunit